MSKLVQAVGNKSYILHELVTRTNDGEVGLTGPALSLLKGKPPHWYYAASAWAASHQRGAKRKFLGLLLGMLKTVYGHWLRECVALAQGERKLGHLPPQSVSACG
ncbi:uncharacterized protein SEPMUDRAFT_113864 [Sphaerulina musiva SO2202]|uniref:Uncharacterized protein n=1 Tax=Sphaerulina musiva (strain SO2202) TaxID=692275 RepID=N1QNZ7_SPHMS|nr:uncharacterized protein SEPMUDRAFT_113864 [Sphaerulina musiva SO2202]EMF17889.1 hypothetical protein SEPMUDRAFT_113864 [Sphaerulina musiva SO2202]